MANEAGSQQTPTIEQTGSEKKETVEALESKLRIAQKEQEIKGLVKQAGAETSFAVERFRAGGEGQDISNFTLEISNNVSSIMSKIQSAQEELRRLRRTNTTTYLKF